MTLMRKYDASAMPRDVMHATHVLMECSIQGSKLFLCTDEHKSFRTSGPRALAVDLRSSLQSMPGFCMSECLI